nr:MAG TPA: hypothetical protein [Caudoviricetes sp.]
MPGKIKKPLCRAGIALRKGFSIIPSLVLVPLSESFQDVPAAMQ